MLNASQEHHTHKHLCIYFHYILNIRSVNSKELAGDNFEFLLSSWSLAEKPHYLLILGKHNCIVAADLSTSYIVSSIVHLYLSIIIHLLLGSVMKEMCAWMQLDTNKECSADLVGAKRVEIFRNCLSFVPRTLFVRYM